MYFIFGRKNCAFIIFKPMLKAAKRCIKTVFLLGDEKRLDSFFFDTVPIRAGKGYIKILQFPFPARIVVYSCKEDNYD